MNSRLLGPAMQKQLSRRSRTLSGKIITYWAFPLIAFFTLTVNIIGSSFWSPGVVVTLNEIQDGRRRPTIRDDRRRSTMKIENTADGEFNGLPLYFVPPNNRNSNAHCVGENFRTDAWHYRSCELHHFCFDIKRREFFIIATPEQRATEKTTSKWLGRYGSISTKLEDVRVSLKTMAKDLFITGSRGIRRELQPWKPSIRVPPIEGYYELPSEIVWIPIETMTANAVNPGHILWDYFLPIYTLLSMFGFENNFIPFVTDQDRFCSLEKPNGCFKMMNKLIPLMGVPTNSFSNSANNFNFNVTSPHHTNIVCARHALVGIGWLNDHGRNKHGQTATDYEKMRNMGRGPELYRFRNFMLRNMGIRHVETVTGNTDVTTTPLQILVSQNSSERPNRQRSFESQIVALKQGVSSDDFEVVVKSLVLADLVIKEQLQVLSQSTVYIGVMGGGAAFASFLPRGSTVVLFFDDLNEWVDGLKNETTRRPVMMDWDVFNNAAYLKVHWLPLSTMDNKDDLDLLVETIQKDLKVFRK